jgi:hypothetical protein
MLLLLRSSVSPYGRLLNNPRTVLRKKHRRIRSILDARYTTVAGQTATERVLQRHLPY